MKPLNEQLDDMVPQWHALLTGLIPEIADEYRAFEDDNIPGMCVTFGFTPETEDKSASWSYQTGDNSYSGGAYFHPHWAIVYLYRDSNAQKLAEDAADQISELLAY